MVRLSSPKNIRNFSKKRFRETIKERSVLEKLGNILSKNQISKHSFNSITIFMFQKGRNLQGRLDYHLYLRHIVLIQIDINQNLP